MIQLTLEGTNLPLTNTSSGSPAGLAVAGLSVSAAVAFAIPWGLKHRRSNLAAVAARNNANGVAPGKPPSDFNKSIAEKPGESEGRNKKPSYWVD